jgi:hypothetical protein
MLLAMLPQALLRDLKPLTGHYAELGTHSKPPLSTLSQYFVPKDI